MMIGSFLGGIVAAAIGERRGMKKGRKAGYEDGYAAGLVEGSKDTPFHVERVRREIRRDILALLEDTGRVRAGLHELTRKYECDKTAYDAQKAA